MSWSRRIFLTSTAAASLAACTFNTARGPSRATADVAVRTLIGQGDKRALPAAGFVVMKQGEVIASAVAGDAAGLDPTEGVQRRPFRIDTPFRAASISKMATALTALRLSNAGLIDLDADIRNYTDLPLLNPAFPDTPITMRQLLAHTSTIQDPEEYWVAAPGDIRSILGPDMFRRTGFDGGPLAYGPGEWLEYANINYGIAANVMEQV
ncbi:MAG: serine hydrolase domain-containing protein, partial [Pseudomonadota bacterium]